ncbi:MAG: CPBP family intramembrane metalloprotease [Anaerolineae bacterium]|nr:CPBP family intramembrane metalloprotease [Anaerolineae bacterium]
MKTLSIANDQSAVDSPHDVAARSPLQFFLLVFVLTIPFWLLGSLTNIQLMPGLPVSAFAVVCPVIAALILVYRQNKMSGVKALLKRAFDFNSNQKGWYLIALLLMPLVMVASWLVQRLTGTLIPAPQITIMSVLSLCLVFFIGSIGEELGWSGYVTDPLQNRWGALRASLILGMVWAVWHYIPLAQANRSVEWIFWWSVGTVSARIIMVWLYNNTGKSVFATVLFHMMINLTWQLYPVNGSYFDPRISGIISALVVVVIVVLWEPLNFTRFRKAKFRITPPVNSL